VTKRHLLRPEGMVRHLPPGLWVTPWRAAEGGKDAPDPVAEVAERNAAALAAYRELSALPHPDAAPGNMAGGTS
jgi:hypothetical protein